MGFRKSRCQCSGEMLLLNLFKRSLRPPLVKQRSRETKGSQEMAKKVLWVSFFWTSGQKRERLQCPALCSHRTLIILLIGRALSKLYQGDQLKCQQSTINSTGAVTLSFPSLKVPDTQRGILNISWFIYQKLSEHLLSPGRETANEDTMRNKLESLSSSSLESCEVTDIQK